MGGGPSRKCSHKVMSLLRVVRSQGLFLFGLVFATAGVHASSALHGPQVQGPRLSFLRTPLALAASVFVIAAAYVVDSCAPATDLKLLKSRN